jgi:transposase
MEKAIKNLLDLRKSSAGNTSMQALEATRLPGAAAFVIGPSILNGNLDEAELSRIKAERDALEIELSQQKANYESELARMREELEAELEKIRTEHAELKGDYEWLLEKYRLKVAKIFGRSRERFAVDGQMVIEGDFGEEEPAGTPPEFEAEPEPEETTITYTRPKRYPGQKADKFANLEERTVEHELPEEERICGECGETLPELAPAVSRRVEVIPPQARVVKTVRHRYGPCAHGCGNTECDGDGADDSPQIIDAPMPQPALPHSIATESAIANVITQKYQFGLPLYRQQQQWKMLGVDISRQTMANWVIMAALTWLILLFSRMKEILLTGDIIMADESSLQVLREPGRPATSKSYMWLFRTAPRAGRAIVLFEYRATRSATVPKTFLKNYRGFLCADGYAAYYSLPGVDLSSCWMHARRGFADALKALPAHDRAKPCLASEGLRFCDGLFKIERGIRQSTDEERFEARIKKSAPLLEKFKSWLDANVSKTGSNTHIGRAIRYALNYWDTLKTFLKDGRLEIDNGASERSIKSFVIGRKGFLFANTPDGAKASAISYSIVETAKENNLKPFEYIKHVLETLPNINVKDLSALDALLPWSDSLPSNCKQTHFNPNEGRPKTEQASDPVAM